MSANEQSDGVLFPLVDGRRSTQTIGVLAFDLSDPFCTPIMRGIQGSLHGAGYLPLIVDAAAQRTSCRGDTAHLQPRRSRLRRQHSAASRLSLSLRLGLPSHMLH